MEVNVMYVLGGLGAAAGAYFLYQRMTTKSVPAAPFTPSPAPKAITGGLRMPDLTGRVRMPGSFFSFGPAKTGCASEIATAAVAKKEFQAAQEEFATIASQMPRSAAKLPAAQTKLAKAGQRLQAAEAKESECKRTVLA